MSAATRVAAALAATGTLVACGAQAPQSAAGAVPTTTAQVVRTDVTSTRQVNGTLTYAGAYVLVNQLAGVYTALPAPGAVIARGQVIDRVDNHPAVLMYGAPEWRALSVGVADGPDVRQLEQNLLALGFGTASDLVANGHFDSFDAAAVRRWQSSLGVPQTGQVGLGDVIYSPGPIRITSVEALPGTMAGPGSPLAHASDPQHVVVVQLDVSEQTLVHTGDAVSVVLPDSSQAAGTVTSIGAVAVAVPSTGPPGAGPSATLTVTVTLSDAAAGGHLDQAPVIVDVTDAVHRSVLAVPVMALLAEAGGNYAVDVVSGSQHHLVTVTIGLFDDRGMVEVTSPELREGMTVEVPQE